MASLTNGQVNGHTNGTNAIPTPTRFSHIPKVIEVPVAGFDEAVELDLVELNDDVTELCTLLENENASKTLWLTVALAYAKQHSLDLSMEIANRGLQSLSRAGQQKDKIGLLSLLCWIYLWKSREAPRVPKEGELISEAKTKDFYLQAATGALNNASRVQAQFPPLTLAKGVLSLMRASLQSSASPTGSATQSERAESLRQALRSFDDVLRTSNGRNMMAVMGKARTFFAMKRYEEAYRAYQDVLAKLPELHEPDPRIGIGCCLWQLNHPDEARAAWQRAADVNPNSQIAKTLLALNTMRSATQVSSEDPKFHHNYEKVIQDLMQKTIDTEQLIPLAYVNLAGLFLDQQNLLGADRMARKAIELTDTNSIASDAWYILAQKEHGSEEPDWARVEEFYNRSDSLKAGEKGFLSAKLGTVQVHIATNRKADARFRLEKLVQQNGTNIEAKAMLGALYAEEVFQNEASVVKEDKSAEHKKALAFLEAVRIAWKDPKRHVEPDVDAALTLAKLYDLESPEKALVSLEEAKKLMLDDLTAEEKQIDADSEEERQRQELEFLPPQFLNNMGCYQFQLERFEAAVQSFQSALNACTGGSTEDNAETDELVTSISYNLARSYEASQLFEEAEKVYQGLLARHPDYIDAQTRLAYLTFEKHDANEGAEAIETLHNENQDDLDVRAFYGWYLNRTKKFSLDPSQDVEQRHHKHTLQQFDKHDLYALTAMGNINLKCAREMPRDTDSRRERRRKQYENALAFFKRVLDLDPKNAYAAQGIAIALIEDQKNTNDAIPIFLKAREVIKDSNVLVNLGHVYAERKEWERAIDFFESALAKDRGDDPVVLSALGRIWAFQARNDKQTTKIERETFGEFRHLEFMQKALPYATQARELAPDDVYYQFNVAFCQSYIAQYMTKTRPEKLSVSDVKAALEGLEESITIFGELAKSKTPPYPRETLEQRLSHTKGALKRQLEGTLKTQQTYEEENAAKVAEVKRVREAAQRRKEDEQRQKDAEEDAKRQRLFEEREKLAAQAREMNEKRLQEEREREEAEYTEDSDGNKIKRVKTRRAGGGKRKKKDDGLISDEDGSEAPKRRTKRSTPDGDGGDAPRKKKRKLARKSEPKANSKYKSAATISDSDEELADLDDKRNGHSNVSEDESDAPPAQTQVADEDITMADLPDDEEEDEIVRPAARKKQIRTIDDDEDDDEEALAGTYAEPPVKPVADGVGAGNPDAGISLPGPAEDSE